MLKEGQTSGKMGCHHFKSKFCQKIPQMDKVLPASPITLLCKSSGEPFTIFGRSFLTHPTHDYWQFTKIGFLNSKIVEFPRRNGQLAPFANSEIPALKIVRPNQHKKIMGFKAKMAQKFCSKNWLKDRPVGKITDRHTRHISPEWRFVIHRVVPIPSSSILGIVMWGWPCLLGSPMPEALARR